jgi:hypothetical protein
MVKRPMSRRCVDVAHPCICYLSNYVVKRLALVYNDEVAVRMYFKCDGLSVECTWIVNLSTWYCNLI